MYFLFYSKAIVFIENPTDLKYIKLFKSQKNELWFIYLISTTKLGA